ncbi:hypothetical protein ACVIGB_000607 [Bradyrhizobium sp. USDA 4341]
MTANQIVLPTSRAKKIAKGIREFVDTLFGQRLPLGFGQDMLAKAFGHSAWPSLKQACDRSLSLTWSRERLIAALNAGADPKLPLAGCKAVARMVEQMLDVRPYPPRELNAAILKFPFDDVDFTAWVDDVPTMCRRGGFASLVASTIESAGTEPQRFLARNAESVLRAISYLDNEADRDVARSHVEPVMTTLTALAGRPCHPAWPGLVLPTLSLVSKPVVLNTLHEVRTRQWTEKDVSRILVGGAFGFLPDAGKQTHEDSVSVVCKALSDQGAADRLSMEEAVASTIGVAILEMRLGYLRANLEPPNLQDVQDLPASPVNLSARIQLSEDGAPTTTDLGTMGSGWRELQDGDRKIDAVWHRVITHADAAKNILAEIEPIRALMGPPLDNLSTGSVQSRTMHVVGYGVNCDAVIPAGAVVVDRWLKVEEQSIDCSVVIEDMTAGPDENPPAIIEALMCSVHDVSEADVSRLQARMDASDEAHIEITVKYKAAPFTPRYERLVEIIGGGRLDLHSETIPRTSTP